MDTIKDHITTHIVDQLQSFPDLHLRDPYSLEPRPQYMSATSVTYSSSKNAFSSRTTSWSTKGANLSLSSDFSCARTATPSRLTMATCLAVSYRPVARHASVPSGEMCSLYDSEAEADPGLAILPGDAIPAGQGRSVPAEIPSLLLLLLPSIWSSTIPRETQICW